MAKRDAEPLHSALPNSPPWQPVSTTYARRDNRNLCINDEDTKLDTMSSAAIWRLCELI